MKWTLAILTVVLFFMAAGSLVERREASPPEVAAAEPPPPAGLEDLQAGLRLLEAGDYDAAQPPLLRAAASPEATLAEEAREGLLTCERELLTLGLLESVPEALREGDLARARHLLAEVPEASKLHEESQRDLAALSSLAEGLGKMEEPSRLEVLRHVRALADEHPRASQLVEALHPRLEAELRQLRDAAHRSFERDPESAEELARRGLSFAPAFGEKSSLVLVDLQAIVDRFEALPPAPAAPPPGSSAARTEPGIALALRAFDGERFEEARKFLWDVGNHGSNAGARQEASRLSVAVAEFLPDFQSGMTALRRGEADEAIEDLTRAEQTIETISPGGALRGRLRQQLSLLHVGQGKAAAELGMPREARAHFRAALELEPDNLEAKLGMAATKSRKKPR
ncbi:MAG: tetratricopeptide repeat protein [Deltaproteobacteria bacterium]|nr:tetratricopeptide repeat protein [Deltaproteobacteria bacterium]